MSIRRGRVWRRLLLLAATVVSSLGWANVGRAAEITFDGFTTAGYVGNPYTENGYVFSGSGFLYTLANSNLDADASASATLGDAVVGGAYITLSKAGGGSFDLNSMQFALQGVRWDQTLPTTAINFIFSLAGGGQSTTTMYIHNQFSGGVPTLETLSFNLPLLSAVTWNSSNFVQWDNVRLDVARAPIPAALPLFASALGGLGFFGWRRKKSTAA